MSDLKKQEIWSGFLVFGFFLTCLAAFFTVKAVAIIPGIFGTIAFLSYRFVFGEYPKICIPSLFWGTLFVAIAGLSIFWAYNPELTTERTTKILVVFLMATMLLSAVSSAPIEQLNKYLWLIPIGVIICGSFAIFELLFDQPLSPYLRPNSLIRPDIVNKPSVFVAVMFFPSILIIHLSLLSKMKKMILAGVLTLVTLTVAILTASEMVQLATIIGLFTALAIRIKWKPVLIVASVIFAAVVLSIPWTAQWAYDSFADTVATTPFIGDGDGCGVQRMEIYNYVSQKALERPFYGFGIEAARAIHFTPEGNYYKGDIFHPHNFAVQSWIEFGVIGALIVSAFGIWILFNISRIKDTIVAQLSLATFSITVTCGFLGFNMWNGWWLGILTMATALLIIISKKQPN